MQNLILKPFDIVAVDGQKYVPYHWLIQWRGLDKVVHCFPITKVHEDPLLTEICDIECSGLKNSKLSEYIGRNIKIYRYKYELDYEKLYKWLYRTQTTSKGYDFIQQYLLGFILGIVNKKYVDDDTRWTCSELCYWLFQDNQYILTSKEEVLPMPRLFVYSNEFVKVYEGTL
jgi:hypothetical protein